MDRRRLPSVLVLLFTTLAISMAQSTTEAPTNSTFKCPRVGFQFFFKNLNQSVTYRVAVKQQQDQLHPNETSLPFGYSNASLSFVRTPHSAFLVFKCHRPVGTSCDVFTAWRDVNTGDLRALRNVLDLDLSRPDLENTLSIEKQGEHYFWCDPERRRRSRFALVPIPQDGNDTEPSTMTTTTTVCSSEHGNTFGGDAEECDVKFLEHMLIDNDLKATGGLNKRGLLMSFVLMSLVGMTLIAIVMAQWMNKSQQIVVAK